MADHWLRISSAELDSLCGEEPGYTLESALDGTGSWKHNATPVAHWFVIDLKQTHTIKKIRGRSFSAKDPIDIDVYCDDRNPPTTLMAVGITTWQDTREWVEIDCTHRNGRYIKIEIWNTEDPVEKHLEFGDPSGLGMTIFDAYGDMVVPICTWLADHGAPNILIKDVFTIVDSYIYNTPPAGYTFIPTSLEVYGTLLYYTGEEGDPFTGCNFFP